MNYARTLFIVGLCIMLIPFLGIPLFWKYGATVLLGLLVMVCGALIRSVHKAQRTVKKTPAPRAPRARRSVAAVRTRAQENRLHQTIPQTPVITSESLIDYDQA